MQTGARIKFSNLLIKGVDNGWVNVKFEPLSK